MIYERENTILQVNNVSLSYDGKLILRDINIEIKNVTRPGISQGQVISFLGPSGAGKSQLSRILSGLKEPTTGEVKIGNQLAPVKAGAVGYVTQNYFLRPNRTVKGNLELAVLKLNKKEAEEKIKYYLDFLQIKDTANLFPSQLSGGQKQRVAIAQQLLCSSHFLIMDEPFSNLDPITRDKTCELILKVSLQDDINTIIIISHDLETVLRLSDTAWLLGRDKDESGNIIPGSRIKDVKDLASRGLCWQPDIEKNPKFRDLVYEIEEEFKYL